MNGVSSVNLQKLEQLYATLQSEGIILNEGFETFYSTVDRLRNEGFLQGQLANELSNVRKKVERVRENYTQCIGSVFDSFFL